MNNTLGTAAVSFTSAAGLPAGLLTLGSLGGSTGWASRINAAGQVVGASATSGYSPIDAYVWSSSTGMRDLGVLPTVTEMNPEALSPGGDVAGDTEVSGADYHAFWWHPGDLEDVGTLGGAWSYAVAVNDSGQVAGTSRTTSPYSSGFDA